MSEEFVALKVWRDDVAGMALIRIASINAIVPTVLFDGHIGATVRGEGFAVEVLERAPEVLTLMIEAASAWGDA